MWHAPLNRWMDTVWDSHTEFGFRDKCLRYDKMSHTSYMLDATVWRQRPLPYCPASSVRHFYSYCSLWVCRCSTSLCTVCSMPMRTNRKSLIDSRGHLVSTPRNDLLNIGCHLIFVGLLILPIRNLIASISSSLVRFLYCLWMFIRSVKVRCSTDESDKSYWMVRSVTASRNALSATFFVCGQIKKMNLYKYPPGPNPPVLTHITSCAIVLM